MGVAAWASIYKKRKVTRSMTITTHTDGTATTKTEITSEDLGGHGDPPGCGPLHG